MSFSRLISRLASGLKKLPDEIRRMRWRDARALLAYWQDCPPEGEMLGILAQVYTTWRPSTESTPEDHMRSLEARWKAGAMNAKQILEAMGGSSAAVRIDGTAIPVSGAIQFPDVRH